MDEEISSYVLPEDMKICQEKIHILHPSNFYFYFFAVSHQYSKNTGLGESLILAQNDFCRKLPMLLLSWQTFFLQVTFHPFCVRDLLSKA